MAIPDSLEQRDDPGRRARCQHGAILDQEPGVYGGEAIHVLGRINDIEDRLRPTDLRRQRILNEDPVVEVAVVQLAHGVDHFSRVADSGRRMRSARQPMSDAAFSLLRT
jgi:hypothetical protein